jgi:hypothetical protein
MRSRTIQTTSIDEPAGLVRLSTVLAHASGEWIASDWPVCAISETATPHRMGAALTYARRYALFALVGIAGEDDLDAPDLLSPAAPEAKADSPFGNKKDHLNGGQGQSVQQRSGGHRIKASSTALRAKLDAEKSAALRERLITELENISSSENAARWAHRVMGAKNTLTRLSRSRAKLGRLANAKGSLHSARPAESFMRSKYWIAASRRRDRAAFGHEAKLTSIANDLQCSRSPPFP